MIYLRLPQAVPALVTEKQQCLVQSKPATGSPYWAERRDVGLFGRGCARPNIRCMRPEASGSRPCACISSLDYGGVELRDVRGSRTGCQTGWSAPLTRHVSRQTPATATRQLDFVFASQALANQVQVAAWNAVDDLGTKRSLPHLDPCQRLIPPPTRHRLVFETRQINLFRLGGTNFTVTARRARRRCRFDHRLEQGTDAEDKAGFRYVRKACNATSQRQRISSLRRLAGALSRQRLPARIQDPSPLYPEKASLESTSGELSA